MSNTIRKPVDVRRAAALRSLRRASGLILKEMSPSMGVSQQILSRWENGQANVPADKLPLFLGLIGKTEADLERVMAEMPDAPAAGPVSRPMSAPQLTPSPLSGLESYSVKDESMSPWCEPGEVVLFDRNEHPRRLEGCLVELKSGERLVRLYERERDGYFFLQRVNPESTEKYLHSQVAGIYRISFRGRH